MKKLLVLNLLCFLIFQHGAAQQIILLGNEDTLFLKHLDTGDSLFKLGENKLAIEEYRKQTAVLENYREKYGDLSQIVWSNYANVFACDNQADSAFSYLNKNLQYDSSADALVNPYFLQLRKDKRWDEFKSKLIPEIVSANHGAIKDVSLAEKLWDMHTLSAASNCHLEKNLIFICPVF